ncbi:Na+/H+ antiporter subunit E [Xanthomonadaceae bacterium JHOS43]|nr:Na+/H+ antiporter subunit E [Xanthomonadaceae bacterium JHOS43]MCX7562570.1 Na+/H+ antiporter subunit E [Xanthomonadaceae bacterium XH05]
MKKRLRILVPSIPLSVTVFVFGLLLPDHINAAYFTLALVLALLIPQAARRLEREFAYVATVRPLPRLIAIVLYDIVRSNIHVARLVLGPESAIKPGWVWVPLDLTNIHGITALASLITLTPGTVSAELSDDRRYLLIHALDLQDPEALIDEIKSRYEAPLKEIFP